MVYHHPVYHIDGKGKFKWKTTHNFVSMQDISLLSTVYVRLIQWEGTQKISNLYLH